MKKNKESVLAAIVVAILFFIALSMNSCSSKSGKRKQEKVVILDSYSGPERTYNHYTYRVKRLEHGVIDMYTDRRLFEVGDTIYATY